MVNYKKIADMMMSIPADRKTMKKEDFEKLMKLRNLKFIQDIDIINESKREVWGNSNFQIIVIHSNNNYQIL